MLEESQTDSNAGVKVGAQQAMPLTVAEHAEILNEIQQQPRWRHIADKEMDYADGNQLDSELMRLLQNLGIPPAVEDLIGPALLSIQGYETNTRTDWRVSAYDSSPDAKNVAEALNYKLNQAERESKADAACSSAFRPQIACGVGWIEVAKESDPFQFPYRCRAIHRNEIHWDMKAREPDLSDARWLRRSRWLAPERVANVFPQHAEMIELCGRHGRSWTDEAAAIGFDGGMSTGLQNAWNEGRAWTLQEEQWYNPSSKEINIAEVWYRRWVRVLVLKLPGGRVVEYDEDNDVHNAAIVNKLAKSQWATVTKLRRSYWLGEFCLSDEPSPYIHRHFPYVPFWGFREDNTNIPYGYVRSMKYPQDSLNSGTSKLRWGMSVQRVERTKGAVMMSDEQLRRQVARPDADILLDQQHMAKAGAKFEVKRDFQLSDQHFQLLQDNRASISRVSNITDAFQGRKGNATSGVQEQTQAEQSNQSLGKIMDNFKLGRRMVGDLLLSMIIADIGSTREEVVIEATSIKPEKLVVLNDEQFADGYTYLSNDVQRTRLKVALEEVPSSSSYRTQQYHALSEAIKPLPPQYVAAALPFLTSLMDVPFQQELVEAFRNINNQASPEQVKAQIQQAVQDALAKAGNDIKLREVAIKERKAESEIQQIKAQTVQTGVQASFSAMQAGAQIAQMPMIAPIADVVMQGAGYERPSPMGDDPNFPVADQTAAMNIKSPYIQGQAAAVEAEAAPPAHENTSPQFPPVPSQGRSPMQGIETTTTADNLP